MNEQIEPVSKTPITIGSRGVQLNSFDELWRFSSAVHKSCFCPKGFTGPADVMIAIQSGFEIGLTPMQSLQSIAVINGRPGIFGDAALAIVRASGLLQSYTQELPTPANSDDERRAVVTSKRVGCEPLTTTFSVSDAKRAKLWGKDGPWTSYPERMLLFRARGFNLRDNFGDVLKGFKTTEELQDYPDSRGVVKELSYNEQSRAITEGVDDSTPSTPELPKRPRGRPRKIVDPTVEPPITQEEQNEAPKIDNGEQDVPKPSLEVGQEKGPSSSSPIISHIRGSLSQADKTEARLLAVLSEWGFASNTTQSLDDVDQQTLEMISKRWEQVKVNL